MTPDLSLEPTESMRLRTSHRGTSLPVVAVRLLGAGKPLSFVRRREYMRTGALLGPPLALLGLAYFYGALLGGAGLFWETPFRDGPPRWAWWQYLVAPLCIGLVAIGVEWLVQKLQERTGSGAPGLPAARRALHLIALFVILALLIAGPAVYKIANP
jgi:hypothetical protein